MIKFGLLSRLSINRKIIIVLTFFYLTLLTLVTYHYYWHINVFKTNFCKEKENIASIIGFFCIEQLTIGDNVNLEQLLHNKEVKSDIICAIVVDSNSAVLAQTNNAELFTHTYQVNFRDTSYFQDRLLFISKPFFIEDVNAIAINLVFSTNDIDEYKSTASNNHLWLFAAFVFVGLIVFLTLSAVVSKPISNLSLSIQKAIKAGRYMKNKIRSKDEIEALDGYFGELLDSLRLQKEEQKRTINELNQCGENAKSIYENISEGLAIQIDGIFVWTNSFFSNNLEINQEQIIGKNIGALLSKSEAVRFADFLKGFNSLEMQNSPFETRTISKSGKVVYLNIFAKHIKYNDNSAILFVFEDITIRKTAQIEAEKNYLIFEQLFRQSNNAMIIMNGKGSVEEINDRLIKLFDWNKQQIEYIKSYNIFLDDKINHELKELIANSLQYGTRFKRKEILKADFLVKSILFGTIDKPQIKLLIEAYPIVLNDKVRFLILQISDITDEDLARERIASQVQELELMNEIISSAGSTDTFEALFQRLFDSINNRLGFESCGVYLLDDSMRIADLKYFRNLEDTFISQLSRIDIAAKPFRITFLQKSILFVDSSNPKETAKFKKWGFQSMASIPLTYIDNEVFGSLCVATKHKVEFSDSEKRILSAVGREIGIVAARIKAENELKENEERYRGILFNSALGIYQTTTDGRLISINPAFARMFGYPSMTEALTSIRNIEEQLYVDKNFRKKFIDRIENESINNLLVETELFKRDGTFFLARINLRAARDKQGDLMYFEGFIEDITERAKVEERLQEMNRELENRISERTIQLEATNKELEAFTYSVSHDLRAPLRAIDGFSLALQEDYGNIFDSTAKDYIKRVRSASQKMGMLIDDLLNLSRITRTELVKEKVDLSSLANEVLNNILEHDKQKKIAANIQDGIFAECDRRLITVVLQNLLDNAVKFSSKNEIIKIEFGDTIINRERVIFVKDYGAGFDMVYADKLFGAFQRLHKQDEFEGTGVGLALVKRVVQKHGGRIWAEGRQNEGAKFYFTLG